MSKTKADPIIGATIVELRPMTESEMEKEYWSGPVPVVVVLNNGTKFYASRDDEGNGPGALFGEDKNGKQFGFPLQYR